MVDYKGFSAASVLFALTMSPVFFFQRIHAMSFPGLRAGIIMARAYHLPTKNAPKTDVVDADLSQYFDTIPHSELLQCVARRIVDKQMLHRITMWLKVPVEETDETGRKRLTGGKDHDRGTPQGGVVTPRTQKITWVRP
jgi:retron-type reverse transcriptase